MLLLWQDWTFQKRMSGSHASKHHASKIREVVKRQRVCEDGPSPTPNAIGQTPICLALAKKSHDCSPSQVDLKVDGTPSVKKLVPKNMIVVDRNAYHTDKISMMYPIEKIALTHNPLTPMRTWGMNKI